MERVTARFAGWVTPLDWRNQQPYPVYALDQDSPAGPKGSRVSAKVLQANGIDVPDTPPYTPPPGGSPNVPKWSVAGLLALIFSVATVSPAQQQPSTIMDLGALGTAGDAASSINNQGQVSGLLTAAVAGCLVPTHAFRTTTSRPINLATDELKPPGSSCSNRYAFRITQVSVPRAVVALHPQMRGEHAQADFHIGCVRFVGSSRVGAGVASEVARHSQK